MRTIINNENDPYYNLALEETLLKSETAPDMLVWLWQNRPAVIIGRHQNAREEVNIAAIRKRGIDVVRRISGGGAVYHDSGNVNFTFIAPARGKGEELFRRFTEPVIDALRSLGVPAEFTGRNDIVAGGKKISGNAQAYYRDRMFHHGTLLFDSDLATVGAVLNAAPDKIKSKGVKSVRSRVANIRTYLKEDITIEEFKSRLLSRLLATDDIQSREYRLSPAEEETARRLAADKYRTWEWNYGRSPAFETVKSGRFAGGKITFHLDIKAGKIAACHIGGDFFGKLEIAGLETALVGALFTPAAVAAVLDSVPLGDYLFNIAKEDILACLFNQTV
ncbi:MAG: lipoate--protein ligase [Bacilli bacterium]|jgi:lipoate-protein ligase A